MKTTTNIIYSAFALVALACFAVLPTARAVVPPPDGGYPGFNTAEGSNALKNLTTGVGNTATGAHSLFANSAGNLNTATGAVALFSNTTGTQNTANGAFALFSNTIESFNTATGFQALFSNTGDGGHYNVATGYQALFSNTTGRRNVAEGNTALYSNLIGNFNVTVGDQALYSLAPPTPTNGNTGGNTAIGWAAMASLISGGGNTVLSNSALVNTTDGFQNTALGYVAGQNLTTGNNNVYISNPSIDTESNTIRIGNVVGFTDLYGFQHAAHTATFIAGINGTAVVGSNVVVDANGQLGTATSSARFKKNIKPMDIASDAILALKPVTFQYNSDAKGTPQFGLIAEDVAKVNSDLVVRDRNGEIYSVRYEAVNAMLLNEFLKEHGKVEKLEATVAKQHKDFDAALADLTGQIQKVSAQLQLNKSAPQTVLNDE